MKIKRLKCLLAIGGLLTATVVAYAQTGPRFAVDPSWPSPLPAPVDSSNVAHPWVQGEDAAACVDQNDNVYSYNRAWEEGISVSGVLQGNESGAIDGNDATPAAYPSPPVVIITSRGPTVGAFGDASLIPSTGAPANMAGGPYPSGEYGYALYMPYGSHGCFVDYKGYVWLGGNGDGIVQEYNPATVGRTSLTTTTASYSVTSPPGAGLAQFTLQIGKKAVCDGPNSNAANTFASCGSSYSATAYLPFDTSDYNNSHVYLNEPPDIAVDPNIGPVSGLPGDIYVADGYGNHRIVVFNRGLVSAANPEGYVGQWGTACTVNGVPANPSNGQNCDAGSFGVSGGGHPHCVVLANDNLVYVCDRPNSRIQVFQKTCAQVATPATTPTISTGVSTYPTGAQGTQPVCPPVRVINIGNNPTTTAIAALVKGSGTPPGTPPYSVTAFSNQAPPVGAANYGLPNTVPGGPGAIVQEGTRGDDVDMWPNIDYLATQSPLHVVAISDVDLGSDNVWILDYVSGLVTGAFGVCGVIPCPGHNAGHFAYAHTVATDSHGNVYIAETITGRRVQKFVPISEHRHDHD